MAFGCRVDDRVHLVHVSADPLKPHAEHGAKNHNISQTRRLDIILLRLPFVLIFSIPVGRLVGYIVLDNDCTNYCNYSEKYRASD